MRCAHRPSLRVHEPRLTVVRNSCHMLYPDSCSPTEQQFLQHVLHEVRSCQQDKEKRVVVFPAHITPRNRFLIHQFVEQNFAPEFKTVSVGPQSDRRTFLFDMSLAAVADRCEEQTETDVCRPDSASGRIKRPSKQLYRPPSATSPPKSLPSASPTSVKTDSPPEDDTCDTWDSLYDDAGNCVDPDLIRDFKTTLKLAEDDNLQFRNAAGDFSDFAAGSEDCDLTDQEFPHVLEVYDFPDVMKTPDLFSRLAAAGSTDFDIVWVNDTHALAVFGSRSAANRALRFSFPDLRIRVLSQATRDSKLKAKKCTDRVLPFKKRPQTSVGAARRLVGRHLGLKMEVSKETLQAERKVLQEAKDRRRQIRKQTDDVWEGKVN